MTDDFNDESLDELISKKLKYEKKQAIINVKLKKGLAAENIFKRV